MGWTFYTDRRVQTYADERAEITRLCTFENADVARCTLIKASKVGSTWYAAVKADRSDGTPRESSTFEVHDDGSYVFGAVFLTRYDEGCWGYKDMDETMGPCASKAPANILNLLSPLKDPESYAHNWRKRCRAWANIPSFNLGDIIKLAEPISLEDGSTCQNLEVSQYLAGKRHMRCYRDLDRNRRVRLSKACLIGSELVKPALAKTSPVLAEFLAGSDVA